MCFNYSICVLNFSGTLAITFNHSNFMKFTVYSTCVSLSGHLLLANHKSKKKNYGNPYTNFYV